MDFTNKHLDKKYPIKEWIRIYTDGSATDAVRNGGGGVYATLPYGTTLERSFACGMRCTNYKAETEAIKEALNMVNDKISKASKVVILSDARSLLQTLENTKDTDLDSVRKKTAGLDGQDGTALERSFACGRRCTNYMAEKEAIKEALNMVNDKISKA
ncbi:reverse transcriptase [Elysia marginata]|uniref:Reverse transcriptase n=1 Tax=Elysia marginata TaxID=1093978 RepID=A0AAV4FVI4_9GAST|nr:reverse transcriptase [Elysia marginata]